MSFLLWIFYPLSLLYQFFFYISKKLATPVSLPHSFVISIGNLTMGGTGKTPFLHFLIPILQQLYPHLSIVILSRGYGGSLSSIGSEVTESSRPEEVGEEQKLHKVRFPEVRVLIGKDRKAIFESVFAGDSTKKIVLLDDGFQHFALRRDIDLVLIDSTQKLGSGFTIPLGILRETTRALHRASAVIFTKLSHPDESVELSLPKPSPPVFHSYVLEPKTWAPYLSNETAPWQKPGARLKLITAVGNPKQVLASVEKWNPGKVEKSQFFRDHYSYEKEQVLQEFKNLGETEWIITTEKDFIKWKPWLDQSNQSGLRCLVMDFPFALLEEKAFSEFLKSKFSLFENET